MRAIKYAEDLFFDIVLFGVGKFVPAPREYLDPIVLKRIMGRRNHHARAELAGPRKVSHARGSHHSREPRPHARSSQAIRQLGRDRRAGFARVHSNQNRIRALSLAVQIVTQRHSERRNRLRIKRRFSRSSTDPICPE